MEIFQLEIERDNFSEIVSIFQLEIARDKFSKIVSIIPAA